MVVSFTFEMDLDKYVIKRDGYTILDMLSDIGGIQAVLYSFFAVLVSVSSYKNFDNTLASKLFRLKKVTRTASIDIMKDDSMGDALFIPSILTNIKEYFLDHFLPKKLYCCKRSRRQRALAKARDTFERELNIIKLFQSQRILKLAFAHLLTPQVLKELKDRSRFTTIDPDDSHSSSDEKDSTRIQSPFNQRETPERNLYDENQNNNRVKDYPQEREVVVISHDQANSIVLQKFNEESSSSIDLLGPVNDPYVSTQK